MAVERFPVEAGHVLMFARAVGDPNPVYSDPEHAAGTEVGGLIAPPTFVQAGAQFDPDYGLRPHIGRPWFGSGKTPSGLQRPAPAEGGEGDSSGGGERPRRGGGGSGLHAEQHYEYHRPLRVGDVLTATTTPGKRWEKQGRRAGTLVFAETITEYRDQDGELVVTARGVAVRTERAVQQ
jgi:acyl dehydratase